MLLYSRGRACFLCLLVGVLAFSACTTTSQPLQRARHADFAGARSALEQEPLQGRKDAAELAKAVLSSEIANAEGIEDRRFIRSLRACSGRVRPPLERRAAKPDPVAAEAALLLAELGRYPGDAGELQSHEDGAWRAVAARATGTRATTRLRHGFFEDDDQRVRRAALDAALELRSERDIEPLLEVSRVDPDPLSRSKALMALGSIGPERVLLALKDRFRVADEGHKLAIIDAYGRPGLREIGGQQQLERISDKRTGFVGLHASYVLSQTKNERLRQKAIARMVELARHGSPGERRLALRRLPADHALTEDILMAAAKSDDSDVRVIALARLLGRPEHQDQARQRLFRIARSTQPQAYEARAALAAAEVEQVLPLLVAQKKSDNRAVREVAGYGLIRLDAWHELGSLLVDEDRGVRRSTACKVLSAAD